MRSFSTRLRIPRSGLNAVLFIYHGAVAVANVPSGALDVVGAVRPLKLITGGDGAVLGPAPSWAPAAVRSARLDGETERRPISAGLTTRRNLQACNQPIIHGPRYTLKAAQFPE
jgi:hypothetical protein